LYDEGSKIPANCAVTRCAALADQMLARYHLRDDQPGAQIVGNPPECQVCHA
jgi:hypothetical protein